MQKVQNTVADRLRGCFAAMGRNGTWRMGVDAGCDDYRSES